MPSLTELFHRRKTEQPKLPNLQEARQKIEEAFEDPDLGSLRLQAFADHVDFMIASDIYDSTNDLDDKKKLLQVQKATNEHRNQNTDYVVAEGHMHQLMIPYGWRFVDEDNVASGIGIRARYLSNLSDIKEKAIERKKQTTLTPPRK